MIYQVPVEATVTVYSTVEVEASSPEEAERLVQADIDDNGWSSKVWQNNPFEVDWEDTENLRVCQGAAYTNE